MSHKDSLCDLRQTIDWQAAGLQHFSGWHGFLTMGARLTQLSARNVLLIAAQRPNSTVVASYEDWRSRGRQVVRGQRGIRLIQSAGATADEHVMHVWDIAQTTELDAHAVPTSATTSAQAVDDVPSLEEILEVDPSLSPFEVQSVATLLALRGGVDRWRRLPDPPTAWEKDAVGALASAERVLVAARRISQIADTSHDPKPSLVPVLVRSARPAVVVGDQIDRDVLVAAHHEAMTFYREQCGNSWVPANLRRRGLSEMLHAESRWAVGYSPAEWTALSDHLRATGYPDRVLEAAGLARRSRRGTLVDRFRDRMMIPVHDPTDSAVVGFLGRANPLTGSTEPKYLNSPETAIYHKGKLLYGLVEGRPLLAAGARPVLVEGALDATAITFAGQGRFVGLASSGTAPTADHIALIDHAVGGIRHRGIVVAYDADVAGRQAAVRTHALIEGIVPTERALCLTLPKGSDPADLLRTGGPDALSDKLITADRRLGRVSLVERG